ncbi:MAG: DUF3261 domain-containing protein [Deltaproteobacteria bacterium]|nr:DUF3261 domain-containing protein [Deltaproteobacteria bacterium]
MKRWLFVFFWLWSCAAPQNRASKSDVPPESFVNMADVPWNFEWRQTIKADYPNPKQPGTREAATLEVVLQKQGNVLTMVGLTPMGTRAFVARQQGVTVTSDTQPNKLPFPAALVFLDVNRSLFVGIGPTALANGWHTQSSHGVDIKDLWRGGLLIDREMFDAQFNSKLSIRYSPGYKAGMAPDTLVLTNHRFGYSLTIKTLEAAAL